MLLTITTTRRPASDLGYLLHKHPGRFQSYDLSFGKAHVFYTEAAEDRCTICLLLDVDPVGIVRGKGSAAGLLAQYVNDRPYAASSFLSVAIAQVLGSALQGRCKDRADLAATPMPLSARIEVLPVRGGEGFLRAVFEPLGYQVEARRPPARRLLSRMGRRPVLLCDRVEDDHSLGTADASLRPGPGLRQPETLLCRRRRTGEAARQGDRLAGRARPGKRRRSPVAI